MRDIFVAVVLPLLRPLPGLHDPLFKFVYTVASSRVIVVAAALAYVLAAASLSGSVGRALEGTKRSLLLTRRLGL
jgi:hypothetical protein